MRFSLLLLLAVTQAAQGQGLKVTEISSLAELPANELARVMRLVIDGNQTVLLVRVEEDDPDGPPPGNVRERVKAITADTLREREATALAVSLRLFLRPGTDLSGGEEAMKQTIERLEALLRTDGRLPRWWAQVKPLGDWTSRAHYQSVHDGVSDAFEEVGEQSGLLLELALGDASEALKVIAQINFPDLLKAILEIIKLLIELGIIGGSDELNAVVAADWLLDTLRVGAVGEVGRRGATLVISRGPSPRLPHHHARFATRGWHGLP